MDEHPKLHRSGSTSAFTCASCLDEVPEGSRLHLRCPTNGEHALCLQCAGKYTLHCCEQAASGSGKSVPLRCFYPECGGIFPEHMTATVIPAAEAGGGPELEGLWDRYEHLLVFQAINDGDSKEDIVVTCAICGEYAEMFVPPSPDFWVKVERKILEGIESIEFTEGQKLRAKKMQLTWETSNLTQTAWGNYNARLAAINEEKEKIVNLRVTELWEIAQLGSAGQEIKQEAPDKNEFRAEIRAEVDKELQVKRDEAKQVLDEILAEAPLRLNESLKAAEQEFAATMKAHVDRMRKQKDWKEVATQLKINNSKTSKGLSRAALQKQKKIQNSKKKAWMQKVRTAEEKQEELLLNDTNKFFSCKKDACDGAMCLGCNRHITKQDIPNHECSLNSLDQLYLQVLETLAQASSRACPQCLFAGMKDLACTHITCEHCGCKWCYVCGKQESKLGADGFSGHNQWDLTVPPGVDKCPMYLHYKYGEQVAANGKIREGDPGRALRAFHLEMQQHAIKLLESRTDSELWVELIEKRFPNGIFQ
eukprot:TRINITY_DN1064_c1_g1_i1.p1 TRINITY_DN1064_c1_g1~~TRINITY_DN1064_c1_g1_i1.p1  ORF type:complete len:535 (+),score=128.95 TRINITY_DN1064_c1_g1_i1:834-2438(+)